MLNSRFTRLGSYVKTIGVLALPLCYVLASLAQADDNKATQVVFQPDPENAPVVFVSSSCTICALDKQMTIGFSADQDGMITLLLITPDGEQSTLLSQAVEANSLQYVHAISTNPIGDHALIALFGEAPGDLTKTLAQLLPEKAQPISGSESEQKGLTIVQQPIQLIPHAIRKFEIVE